MNSQQGSDDESPGSDRQNVPPSGSAMIVAVDFRDRGVVAVVGAGRYTDGSRIVQVVTPGESPGPDGWGVTYRTFGRGEEWKMLLKLPRKLAEFIRTQPVGTHGHVAGRKVEVIDVSVAVPTGVIVVTFPYEAVRY